MEVGYLRLTNSAKKLVTKTQSSKHSLLLTMLIAFAILLTASSMLLATTYYVATNGSDANNGTSVGTAFRTVQKGVDTAQPGDTIQVGSGTFNERVVFVRSGTTNSRIVLKGTLDGNGNPITTIDGGTIITTQWTDAGGTGNVWRTPLTTKINGENVYSGSLPNNLTINDSFILRMKTSIMDDSGGLGFDMLHNGPLSTDDYCDYPSTTWTNTSHRDNWHSVDTMWGWGYNQNYLYIGFGDTGINPNNETISYTLNSHAGGAVVSIDGRSYITVRDLSLRNGDSAVWIAHTASNCLVENNILRGGQATVRLHGDGTTNRPSSITINNNDISLGFNHTLGSSDPSHWFIWGIVKNFGLSDHHGIFLQDSGSNVIISNNDIIEHWDGIQNYDVTANASTNLIVSNNYLENLADDGLEPDGGEENAHWRDNTVINANYAYRHKGVQVGPMYVYRNKFYSSTCAGIYWYSGNNTPAYIYHNSFATSRGMNFGAQNTGYPNVWLANNIFSNDTVVPATCSWTSGLPHFNYNYVGAELSSRPTWWSSSTWGSNNVIVQNGQLWSANPPDFKLATGDGALRMGVDLSQDHTLSTTIDALPGMDSTYYVNGSTPDAGALQAAAPVNVSVSPNTGSTYIGIQKTFTSTFSDANGANDLYLVRLLIDESTIEHGVELLYKNTDNTLAMKNNTGQVVGWVPLGQANGTIVTESAILDCQNTTVTKNGNTMVVTWKVTFLSPMGGRNCNLYALSSDNGLVTGWTDLGDYSIINATVPGAPTKVAATATAGQAIVSFTAPASNGGSTITSYTATSTPGNITGTVNQSGSGSITVTGLSDGIDYTFKVKATNAVGTGPESTASYKVTPMKTIVDIDFDNITTNGSNPPSVFLSETPTGYAYAAIMYQATPTWTHVTSNNPYNTDPNNKAAKWTGAINSFIRQSTSDTFSGGLPTNASPKLPLLTSTKMTISAWIKYDTLPTVDGTISRGLSLTGRVNQDLNNLYVYCNNKTTVVDGVTATYAGISFKKEGGKAGDIYPGIAQVSDYASAATGGVEIEAGEWYLFTYTFDWGTAGTSSNLVTLKTYVNGKLQATVTGDMPTYTPSYLDTIDIGYCSSSNLFTGQIDDLKIVDAIVVPAIIDIDFDNPTTKSGLSNPPTVFLSETETGYAYGTALYQATPTWSSETSNNPYNADSGNKSVKWTGVDNCFIRQSTSNTLGSGGLPTNASPKLPLLTSTKMTMSTWIKYDTLPTVDGTLSRGLFLIGRVNQDLNNLYVYFNNKTTVVGGVTATYAGISFKKDGGKPGDIYPGIAQVSDYASAATGGIEIKVGEWNLFTYTLDWGTADTSSNTVTLKTYVNGYLQATVTGDMPTYTPSYIDTIDFGYTNSANLFTAQMDNLKIYDSIVIP